MKTLKVRRVKVLGRPTEVGEIDSVSMDDFEDDWQLEAEKMEVKRLRAWRHQLGS